MQAPTRYSTVLKLVFALGAAWPLAAAAADAPAPIQPVDAIAAVVNSQVITRNELAARYDQIAAQLKQQNVPLPPKDVLEKQVLERMITKRVLLQHAQETGIRVDPVMLDQAIQRVAEQNHMSVEQLKEALTRDGMGYERFRDRLKDQMLVDQARQRDVDNRITVSDAEIAGYLQTQATQGANEQYDLSQIYIAVPESATPAEIQAKEAKAEEVLQKLRAGGNFEELSASYSDAPNALQGGALGWRDGGQFPPDFLQIIARLPIGGFSNILRTNSGFYIFKLNGKRAQNEKLVVTQSWVREILVKTDEATSAEDAKQRLESIRDRIVHGAAAFADMARQYSQDPSSAKGGDIGWVNPGATLPEFQKVMDSLKPGELSQPFETPLGWYLIEVTARREKDMTAERAKLEARKAIFERKAEEAYQDWVRQLRDAAYVEIFPPY